LFASGAVAYPVVEDKNSVDEKPREVPVQVVNGSSFVAPTNTVTLDV
jgi:hypothetical protein